MAWWSHFFLSSPISPSQGVSNDVWCKCRICRYIRLWKQFSDVYRPCFVAFSMLGLADVKLAWVALQAHSSHVMTLISVFLLMTAMRCDKPWHLKKRGSWVVRGLVKHVIPVCWDSYFQLESSDPAQPFTAFDCLLVCLIFFSLLILLS